MYKTIGILGFAFDLVTGWHILAGASGPQVIYSTLCIEKSFDFPELLFDTDYK